MFKDSDLVSVPNGMDAQAIRASRNGVIDPKRLSESATHRPEKTTSKPLEDVQGRGEVPETGIYRDRALHLEQHAGQAAQVEPGVQRLRISAPGYAPWTGDVDVARGGTTTRRITLTGESVLTGTVEREDGLQAIADGKEEERRQQIGFLAGTAQAAIEAVLAEIDRIDAQLGRFQGRIRRDDWVGQASLLAAGDDSGFAQRYGKLS